MSDPRWEDVDEPEGYYEVDPDQADQAAERYESDLYRQGDQ